VTVCCCARERGIMLIRAKGKLLVGIGGVAGLLQQ
jgi:hypothetical protein